VAEERGTGTEYRDRRTRRKRALRKKGGLGGGPKKGVHPHEVRYGVVKVLKKFAGCRKVKLEKKNMRVWWSEGGGRNLCGGIAR